MLLEELPWTDIQTMDKNTIVIIPFGAVEQHGRHCPLMTDALLGREIARRLDAKFNNELLVLPMMWLGASEHHLAFPGTISASITTYIQMAAEIVRSVARAGFKKILILNSHGGNRAPLRVALDILYHEFPEHTIAKTSYWVPAAKAIEAIRESTPPGIGHAGEMETSMVMAVRPDTVRVEFFEKDGKLTGSEFTLKDMFHHGGVFTSFQSIKRSNHGGFGDPTKASPEKGEKFFDAITQVLEKVVIDLQNDMID